MKLWPLPPAPRLILALLVIAAATVRLAFLDWKPPHYDEGMNGYFVNQLWAKGYADYDPTNFHGPLYFYYLHLAQILFGHGVVAFRFATALLSTATVYVAALHSRYLGRAAYWAAAILALSPAFVFYGRYAIHESLLILFQVCFSYGFLAWHHERSRRGWMLMLVGIFGSIATKETFIIFFGCWLIAVALVRLVGKYLPPVETGAVGADLQVRRNDATPLWRWTVALILALATLALFSGFFLDPRGIVHMVTAFAAWTKTGTAHTGHEKPFLYWFELLRTYEGPMLFGLALGSFASLVGSKWMRVYTAAGIGVALAYSIIPYKTPWNIIGFWPLAFAAGFIVVELRRPLLQRTAQVILAVGIAAAAVTMVRLNFRDFENPKERYVYVQSRNDLNTVLQLIERRVEIAPEDQAMPIRFWMRDTWPLPGLMTLYPDVGYGKFVPGLKIDGVVVLIDGSEKDAFESALKTPYLRIPFQIRDSYLPGFAYFEQARFKDLLPRGTDLVGTPSQ